MRMKFQGEGRVRDKSAYKGHVSSSTKLKSNSTIIKTVCTKEVLGTNATIQSESTKRKSEYKRVTRT